MTNLIGSEKQIKWAEEIRETVITCMENLITASNNKFNNMEMPETSRNMLSLGMDFLTDKLEEVKQKEKAIWFIDNRNYIRNATMLSGKHMDKKYAEISYLDMFNMELESFEYRSVSTITKATLDEYVELF